jgi:glycosyltransferase involved in cell wall biosynthesis
MKQPIKIAHLIPSRPDNLYGGDVVVLNLAKNLNQDEFKPYILSFKESRLQGEPLVLKRAREMGIEALPIVSMGKFDLGITSRLNDFINKNDIDIIHSHGYKADFFVGWLKKTKLKRIATLHGWWPGSSLKLKLYNLLDIWSLAKFDKIVAVNDKIKQDRSGINLKGEKIAVINNGIDLEEINKAGSVSLSNNKNEIVVVMAGRLSKEKGHKYLFEAMSKMDSIKAIIVGKGPFESSLKSYVENNNLTDKVEFIGFRENVLDYIKSADIFILPSISEGLPLSLLEAMALKKVVIASAIGGIPSVIKDKHNGILIRPGNYQDIIRAIDYIRDNKVQAEVIAANARKTIEDNYSITKMVNDYQELYKGILHEK